MRLGAALALLLALCAAGSGAAAVQHHTECSDARDNDGDALVDYRFDPGCTSASDASEASGLRCSLEHSRVGRTYTIVGRCSGPFAKLVVAPPPGARIDPDVKPEVEHAHRCRLTAGKLTCAMKDGRANRGHVVRVGFVFGGNPKGPARVTFGDTRDRAVPWNPSDVGGEARDPTADLRIDVSGPREHVHDPRERNQEIGYYVRVRNTGPAESPGGVVTYDVRGAGPGMWSVGTGGYVRRPCVLRLRQCQLQRMPPGAVAEIYLSVPAPPSAGPGAQPPEVTVSASVTGEAPDPVKLSNSDTARTPVERPYAEVEVHAAVSTERATIDKETGVALVRVSALLRNLGPLKLTRAGEAELDFRAPKGDVKLARLWDQAPCRETENAFTWLVLCDVPAHGAEGGGWAASITVAVSTPGAKTITVVGMSKLGGTMSRSDSKTVSFVVLPPPK